MTSDLIDNKYSREETQFMIRMLQVGGALSVAKEDQYLNRMRLQSCIRCPEDER